jgi:dTDP-4-dehydrorhamnose reductase
MVGEFEKTERGLEEMTWLVVGKNGQLGKALTRVLAERKIDFRAVGSNDLDIRSASKCSELIGALKPSVIINAAAWTDVDGAEMASDQTFRVNAYGTLNLVVAAKVTGAIFTQVSTDYIFSGKSECPWQEDSSPSPTSIYGKSKAAGEVAVLNEYPERSYIFRTAWLYSPWGKNFAKVMTNLALIGDGEVQVVNDQVGQPTSATDLAEQIVSSILMRLPFQIYHATNSGQGSWFNFAQEIFRLVGADNLRIKPVASNSFPRVATRPAYSVLGHDKWVGSGIDGMRDWKIALAEAMPAIVSAVKGEE